MQLSKCSNIPNAFHIREGDYGLVFDKAEASETYVCLFKNQSLVCTIWDAKKLEFCEKFSALTNAPD